MLYFTVVFSSREHIKNRIFRLPCTFHLVWNMWLSSGQLDMGISSVSQWQTRCFKTSHRTLKVSLSWPWHSWKTARAALDLHEQGIKLYYLLFTREETQYNVRKMILQTYYFQYREQTQGRMLTYFIYSSEHGMWKNEYAWLSSQEDHYDN